MKALLYIVLPFLSFSAYSQDSLSHPLQEADNVGNTMVIKDARLDLFAKKEIEYNEALALGPRTAKGYRLMLLSTNDRKLAMNVRAQLLQHFPEQKVYMSFQPPNIKLKFGNFLEKDDAEKYKKEIVKQKLVSTNIYVVPELIEVKPDKNKDKETETNK
jgi:hypothetical protein